MSLSLGGELRERAEYISAPAFSLTGKDEDAFLLHRVVVSADMRVGGQIRLFVSVGNHLSAWKNKPLSSPDVDKGDLQQGFAELRVSGADGDGMLRVGRQELSFGSQRLVSVRDPKNVRQSFDGVRLSGKAGNVALDAFAVRPIALKPGYFDDSSDRSQGFWGVYGTYAPSRAVGIDAYYLGFQNDNARFGTATGRESRHSVGSRIFGKADDLDWNVEGVWQFGHMAGKAIRAWTVASDTGYTFADAPWSPRLGLRADIASGDHDPKSNTFRTFNPLFPKFGYFSDADLTSPNNFIDLHPALTVLPAKGVAVTFGLDFLWRQTVRDAVYAVPKIPVSATVGRGGPFTGKQAISDISWTPVPSVELKASFARFWTSDSLRALGGKNVTYLMSSVTGKF